MIVIKDRVNLLFINRNPVDLIIKKTGFNCRFRYWLHADRPTLQVFLPDADKRPNQINASLPS
jgi:hypothetical protein